MAASLPRAPHRRGALVSPGPERQGGLGFVPRKVPPPLEGHHPQGWQERSWALLQKRHPPPRCQGKEPREASRCVADRDETSILPGASRNGAQSNPAETEGGLLAAPVPRGDTNNSGCKKNGTKKQDPDAPDGGWSRQVF